MKMLSFGFREPFHLRNIQDTDDDEQLRCARYFIGRIKPGAHEYLGIIITRRLLSFGIMLNPQESPPRLLTDGRFMSLGWHPLYVLSWLQAFENYDIDMAYSSLTEMGYEDLPDDIMQHVSSLPARIKSDGYIL